MKKSIKFIILLLCYSIGLYLAYAKNLTTYAYIIFISITWIAIIQKLDKELSNSEKIISSIIIGLETVIAIIGNIGNIPAIIGVVGTLLTEMIFYVLIKETTEVKMPKTLRTIVLILSAGILAFLAEKISQLIIQMTSDFFESNENIINSISKDYSLNIFLYNLQYSLPLYLNIFLIAYMLKEDSKTDTTFNDLRYVVIIVLIPLCIFAYENILSDQYIKEGQKLINNLQDYETYTKPNQYSRALATTKIGDTKQGNKDEFSYYNDNYFYEAPYSIGCIIYNYKQSMENYVNTTKARYNSKENSNTRELTSTAIENITNASQSCKSNSIYMWVIYLINSLVILSSYLLYRNNDNKTKIPII